MTKEFWHSRVARCQVATEIVNDEIRVRISLDEVVSIITMMFIDVVPRGLGLGTDVIPTSSDVESNSWEAVIACRAHEEHLVAALGPGISYKLGPLLKVKWVSQCPAQDSVRSLTHRYPLSQVPCFYTRQQQT